MVVEATQLTAGNSTDTLRNLHEEVLQTILREGIIDNEGLYHLLSRSEEFKSDLERLYRGLSRRRDFASEEVPSKYGYFSGYTSPRPIAQQIACLQKLLPKLGIPKEYTEKVLPRKAEGSFVIPRWQSVADTYENALEVIFNLLKKTSDPRFNTQLECKKHRPSFRLFPSTVVALNRLHVEQRYPDMLVFPGQFGLNYRGLSPRRARVVMSSYEFGLDPFSVGCMLLTHPDRLKDFSDLWIDCPGADYDADGSQNFQEIAAFSFRDGKIKCSGHYKADAGPGFGSATGFLV